MRAMVLAAPGPVDSGPLTEVDRPMPEPGYHEVLVKVLRCGVCRTDLHVVEGELPPKRPTIVPGHEIVGEVTAVGPGVESVSRGQRVGIPWMRRTCGACEYCRTGRENLCDLKRFTGYTDDGGYAEYATGDERFLFPLGDGDPAKQAPLLCAGIIGYRALKVALPRPGGRIGFFGFGGSAHLTLQVASRMGYETVAYSREPDHLALATELGATETVRLDGPSTSGSPKGLDGAVVFAPAGTVVLDALRALRKGGTVAIASIHMTPLPPIDYDRWLFGERRIASVEANTRADAEEFLRLAPRLGIASRVQERPLVEANGALQDLKAGRIVGTAVLDPTGP